MLPTMLITLPMNILMKKTFKMKRPKSYYGIVKGSSMFEGSFPSFHSQFSAGEATTFILGIALFSSERIRFVATLFAIVIAGVLSVLIAISRVAIGMHHIADAIGGFLLGVLIGFCVVYGIAKLWETIPILWHLSIIATFVAFVFILSDRQRRLRA